MSKQPRIALDSDTLKPIIEAMIFASEEPLSARALLRLLAGEREENPPLVEMMAAVETAADAVQGPAVETEPVAEAAVERAVDAIETIDDMPVESPDDLQPPQASEPEPVAVTDNDDAGVRPDIPSAIAPEEEGAAMPAGHMDAPIFSDAGLGIPGQDLPPLQPGVHPDGSVEPADGGIADQEHDGGTMTEGELHPGSLTLALERAESRVARRELPATLDQAYLRAMIDELNDEYESSGRVFRIVEVAGGFQFATIRDYGEFVAMLSKDKARRRLSPAALETLAILAYRQPVSKPEVEAIRGVNCDQVLLSLMEKNLIVITGRSEAVGRPLLYGTTEEFLRIFGLRSLGDLPKLREIEELMEEDAYSAERTEVIMVDADTDVEEIEAKVGAAGYAHDPESGVADEDAGVAAMGEEAMADPAGAGGGDAGLSGELSAGPVMGDGGDEAGGVDHALAGEEGEVMLEENILPGAEDTAMQVGETGSMERLDEPDHQADDEMAHDVRAV